MYDGGGTLTIHFYTNVGDSAVLERPWANDVFQRPETRQDIVLNDIPSLSGGQDWQSISLPPEGLAGSLNGAEGRFTCLVGCGMFARQRTPVAELGGPTIRGTIVPIT